MRTRAIFSFLAVCVMVPGQQRPRPEKLYTGAAEVQEMTAKAAKERKPDQGNFIQPLLTLAPYNFNLEYRDQSVDTPPLSHLTDAEMIYVVDGAAVITTGGTLVDEKKAGANLTGTSIQGGTPRRIAKGDFVMVPASTPHAFTKTEGHFVIMSVHMPKDGAGK